MRKFNFKIKNVKLAFVILIILAVILLLIYYHFIFANAFAKNNFANQMTEIAEENESPIFSIQKITLYNNANAIDNSENQSLSNMAISQYSDISIFLDNSQTVSDLTDENTVKELYIDNINISTKSQNGTKILNYKNPLNFGKYQELSSPDNGRINFNIVNNAADQARDSFSSAVEGAGGTIEKGVVGGLSKKARKEVGNKTVSKFQNIASKTIDKYFQKY